ncbi:hypothetical protein [Phocaeicola sp.]
MKDLQDVKNTEYQSPCCTVVLLQAVGAILSTSLSIEPIEEEDWG